MYNIRGKQEILKIFCIKHITTDIFIFSDLERKIINQIFECEMQLAWDMADFCADITEIWLSISR